MTNGGESEGVERSEEFPEAVTSALENLDALEAGPELGSFTYAALAPISAPHSAPMAPNNNINTRTRARMTAAPHKNSPA